MEDIIWEDKNGNEYTANKLTDGHIINILKRFNEQEVDEDRARMLELVKEEAKKRGIEQVCDFGICYGEVYEIDETWADS